MICKISYSGMPGFTHTRYLNIENTVTPSFYFPSPLEKDKHHECTAELPFVSLEPFAQQPFPLANASLLNLSVASVTPVPLAATWLGVLQKLGGTSKTGLLVKKLRGRNNSVIGSTGMTGKSSGAGMWVTPKVCHSTTSVLSTDPVPSPTHSGKPSDGSPDVCGTWRPAGQSWSSLSVSLLVQ